MKALHKFTGLPGGPNEHPVSEEGYRADSPDRNNAYNVIPSGHISMHNVPHPVYGQDNLGNGQMMYPGEEYMFPGSEVTEIPIAKSGINIKPENKGKFTAKANAAGMGVQEFASKVLSAPEGRYSPETRKQANFARNASGWKKQDGGVIKSWGTDPSKLLNLQTRNLDNPFTKENEFRAMNQQPTVQDPSNPDIYDMEGFDVAGFKAASQRSDMRNYQYMMNNIDENDVYQQLIDEGKSHEEAMEAMQTLQDGGERQFEHAGFDVLAQGLNAPFIGQPGYYDYASHFEDKKLYGEAQDAKPFATFQHNPYEEGTKDWAKKERQNIKSVNKSFKEAKKQHKQIIKGKGKAVPVFNYGGDIQTGGGYNRDEVLSFQEGGIVPGYDTRELEIMRNTLDDRFFGPTKMPMMPAGSIPQEPDFRPIVTADERLMQQYMSDLDAANTMERAGQRKRAIKQAEKTFMQGQDQLNPVQMQDGGYIDMELDDDQIASLRAQGYKIELL